MKHILFSIVVCMVAILPEGLTQDCADQDRYIQPKTGTIQRTTVTYATARGYFNELINLSMDVFRLSGDNTINKPLIVFAHGGSFIFGTRQDMRELCELYASMGYVTATIDYRLYNILLGFPDSTRFVDVAFNAISDMRAAVRYFKADAERDNTFNIDPDKIFAGGLSAGAIMALHTAVLDKDDPQSPEFAAYIATKGGIEGMTGDSVNLSYDSEVAGVIGLSGALFNLDWLDPDDPQMLMIHGDNDEVVPYNADTEGALNLIFLYGSASIHEKSLEIGADSYFVGVPGGGHTDIYSAPAFSSYVSDFQSNGNLLLRNIICNEGILGTKFQGLQNHLFKLMPNPATHIAGLLSEIEGQGLLKVYDSMGRLVESLKTDDLQRLEIDVQSYTPGLFHIQIWKENKLTAVLRLVVQR